MGAKTRERRGDNGGYHVPKDAATARRDECGGYVLPMFAVTLIVLLGFAGIGVDVWNWYHTAQRLQRAADAGALAGVVYMPADPGQANTIARGVIAQNGYTTAADITVGSVTDRPSRLRVQIHETVTNNFLQFLGNDDTTIRRDAVAEFQGAVPMGSPVNQLGNDPFGNQANDTVAPRFWLNEAAPNATTQSGDRHQARNCASAADNCVGSPAVNADYSPEGYFFAVDVRAVGTGPLRIQAYDPGFMFVGDRCDADSNGHLFPAGDPRLATLALPPYSILDAPARYVTGNTQYCAGDQDIVGRDMDTTFIVREPDDTPYSNTDNPVLCTKRFDDHNTADATALYNQLISNTPTLPENMLFRDYFRQWVDLCTDATPNVGQYFIQVRSNATAAAPLTYDATINTGGHNRYSLRAGFGSSPAPAAVNATNVGLFANGRLPIYVNQNDGTSVTNFYLARVEPLAANRTLELNFFDIGDVSGGTVTLTILPPSEATTASGNFDSFPGCRFTPVGYPAENLTGCSRSGMASSSTPVPFQGRLARVLVPIPSDYDCNEASFETGCWLRVQMTFTGGAVPTDTTTWSANILGDPVRLVE